MLALIAICNSAAVFVLVFDTVNSNKNSNSCEAVCLLVLILLMTISAKTMTTIWALL